MKPIWIGTSWKMNKTSAEADEFASALAIRVQSLGKGLQPFVIPPFPYVREVACSLSDFPVKVGAQNMAWAEAGAFTGEVSATMLRDCGADLVEIGHSERREMFGETDERVNLKVHAALDNGLQPLVCVGDSRKEKDWGVSVESVVRQVKIALHGVSADQATRVLLAYEPIWAIGEHGSVATPEEAEQVQAAIRAALVELYGAGTAANMVLLYGGSVNQDNAAALLDQANIDGLFVGRAAWKPEGFIELLEIAERRTEV